MTDKQKQTFIDEYNAAELLHDMALINDNVYRNIEHTLLRTIIGHLAIECNKVSEISTDSEKDDKVYCTECPYFKYTKKEDSDRWYGTKCEKDNHEAQPSMYAIKSLHDRCPLTSSNTGEPISE